MFCYKVKTRLKRLFYKIITPIRMTYWYIFRPKTYGVKVIIENEGKVLMIRNSYGTKLWTFPGGGKKRNETPEEGAKREALEEVGLCLDGLEYLGSYFNESQYKRDTAYCFYKKVDSDYFKIDDDEVEEGRWFAMSDLPQNQSRVIRSIMEMYREHFKK